MKKQIQQLSKGVRNPWRRFWRSAINRRLVRATSRIGVASLFLMMAVGIAQTPGTNAFFTDTASSTGNTMTAGYWTPPTITITSPATGNEWQAGSTHYITWSAASADPSATAGMLIGISYTCDGVVWTNIAAGTANDGSFPWIVPGIISDDCQVSITATDSHGLTNTVDGGTFEISSLVVLNEFMPDPVGDDDAAMPGGEWVELYNNGTLSINVGGWYLYDADDAHELEITASNTNTGGTIVAPHGWLVVYRNADTDFSLNNGGDTVRLFNGVIGGSGVSLVDSTSYTVASESGNDDPALGGSKGTTNPAPVTDVSELAEGKTWARFPDGTGPWFDPVPTPGGKNSKSMDLSRFQEYYKERCIEDGKRNDWDPVCEEAFLISLGVIEAENEEEATPAAVEPGDDVMENADENAEAGDSAVTLPEEAATVLGEDEPLREEELPSSENEDTPVLEPEESAALEEDEALETEEVSSDEPAVEEPEAEAAKQEEIVDDSGTEAFVKEESKTEESKAEEPAEEPKKEEVKATKEEPEKQDQKKEEKEPEKSAVSDKQDGDKKDEADEKDDADDKKDVKAKKEESSSEKADDDAGPTSDTTL